MIRKFKHFLYSLQLFFESHQNLRIFLYTLSVITIIIFSIFGLPNCCTEKPWKYSSILLGLIGLIVLLFDFIHFQMIVSNRKELDARKKLISGSIASLETDYEYSLIEDTHIIKENGDGIIKRHIKLRYSGINSMWYSLDLGSTNSEGDFKKIHVEVYKYPGKVPVPRITFLKVPYRMQTIVILDPPLSESNPQTELEIITNFPRIWNLAVSEEKKDDGVISLYKEVDDFHFTIIPPKKRKIKNFDIINQYTKEKMQYKIQENGSVECEFKKPPRGIYKYYLELD